MRSVPRWFLNVKWHRRLGLQQYLAEAYAVFSALFIQNQIFALSQGICTKQNQSTVVVFTVLAAVNAALVVENAHFHGFRALAAAYIYTLTLCDYRLHLVCVHYKAEVSAFGHVSAFLYKLIMLMHVYHSPWIKSIFFMLCRQYIFGSWQKEKSW